MKEQALLVLYWLLGAFAVYSMLYTVRWHWFKWRWGCRRCAYRKTVQTLNGTLTTCTASCGNNEGRTCSAWFYEDPRKEDDDA